MQLVVLFQAKSIAEKHYNNGSELTELAKI